MPKLKRPQESTSRQEAAEQARRLGQVEGKIAPRAAPKASEPPLQAVPEPQAPEPAVEQAPAPIVKASRKKRGRRAGEPSGQLSHLQVRIPRELHNRYKRLQSDAYLDGEKISQRSWLLALLEGGPSSAADLRELIERALPEAKQAYSGVDSVVGALVPVELSRRYRAFLNNLEIDENFSASMVQVIICLMHEGPETQGQLEELVGEDRAA